MLIGLLAYRSPGICHSSLKGSLTGRILGIRKGNSSVRATVVAAYRPAGCICWALQQLLDAFPASDLLFTDPVKSGLVAISCGHVELLGLGWFAFCKMNLFRFRPSGEAEEIETESR